MSETRADIGENTAMCLRDWRAPARRQTSRRMRWQPRQQRDDAQPNAPGSRFPAPVRPLSTSRHQFAGDRQDDEPADFDGHQEDPEV